MRSRHFVVKDAQNIRKIGGKIFKLVGSKTPFKTPIENVLF